MARHVASIRQQKRPTLFESAPSSPEATPLWQLDIADLAGQKIESRGREEVNRLLSAGWILLHIYTLKYKEIGIWRERPTAILGRPRSSLDDSASHSSNIGG